jgi:hypothetical protein
LHGVCSPFGFSLLAHYYGAYRFQNGEGRRAGRTGAVFCGICFARIRDRNSSFGREERQKREGPAVIAGPSQSAGKFGVAFRSFGT